MNVESQVVVEVLVDVNVLEHFFLFSTLRFTCLFLFISMLKLMSMC